MTTYWIEWCRYYPKEDGVRTHAVREEEPRALCGVKTTDSGGGKVGEDGDTVGCLRCHAALVRLGVIKSHK